MMDPSVSVPIVIAAMFAAAAIAEPLLEHGVADGTYGFCIGIPKLMAIGLRHLVLGVAMKPICHWSFQGTEK